MISIIICTYNRSDSLKDVLVSLLNQELDKNVDYEVIVVDNNSKDDTKKVVESYIPRFGGGLRYVTEKNQGISFARNRGIKEAMGNIVAFTDDDEIADPKWVKHIHETFQKENCDALGGKILLKWLASPPKWLTGKFYRTLGFLDYGNKPFCITNIGFEIFSGNLAVKKSVCNEIGNFNTLYGHKGNRMSGGEDIDLFQKFLSANKKIYYQPQAVVYHKIEKYKLTKKYFRKWHFDKGQLQFELNQDFYKKPGKPYPFGIPYWLFRKLFKMIFRHLKEIAISNRPSDELFKEELGLFYHMGIMAGAYNLRNSVPY